MLLFATVLYRFTKNRPKDGSYTVSNTHKHFNWFKLNDHTSNDGNGRMLIVNASYKPGEFFRLPISGLCKSTFYEFSSWIVNLTKTYTQACGLGIPVNVSYEIWNKTDEKLLASGNTGPIYGGSEPTWKRFALMFQTRPNETSVILKIRNNGKGGCGNDLALDDIALRPCGDIVNIVDENDNNRITVNAPFTTTLIAKPKFEAFPFYFYQWQQSENGINWSDIPRAKNNTYKIMPSSSKMYYRTKVSNKIQDLNYASCYYFSEPYIVSILKSKPKTIKRPPIKGVSHLDLKGIVSAKLSIKTQHLNFNRENLPRTHLKVIIVKHNNKVIYDKVWFDGAIGKFVQTGKKIIRDGDPRGYSVIYETVYTKAGYGYNSSSREYVQK